jgi:phosphoribosylformylglycinamidine (FGAM) synthase-like enzyme
MTNCLNYGNPERPEIMWQLVRGIEGLRDAAIAFDTPVISGNVSLLQRNRRPRDSAHAHDRDGRDAR